MSPKTQLWLARIIGLVALAGLIWMLIAVIPNKPGTQISDIGVEFGQRANEAVNVARDYAFVADYTTKQYWPNREPYISRIERKHRVYILDQAALSEFKGYTRGPD